MASYSVENANPGASMNSALRLASASDIPVRSFGNRSINASDANAAGDDFTLVSRHELRKGQVTLNVAVSGGTYTSVSVALEARIPGGLWTVLGTMSTVGGGVGVADIQGYKEFRANKTASVTATGTPVVTADLSLN